MNAGPSLAEVGRAIATARRDSGHHVLLILHPARIDEMLTDHGYAFVDGVLDCFHERIESLTLSGGRTIRIGHDRHAVVLAGLRDPDLALLAAQKIQRAFERPAHIDGQELRIEAVAGITEIAEGLEVDELARRCEVALVRAAGRAEHMSMFDPRGLESTGLTRLRQQVRSGLERAEFVLHYQPKVRGSDMHPLSTEGLVRWHRDGSLVMPSEFIPLVENSALVMPFTRHCVNMAIRQAADWSSRGLDLGVAVNVPPGAVLGTQMVDIVRDALTIWSAPPDKVTLEITETAMMEEPRRCIETLRLMRGLGVQISMDDFGTGFSSLAYFRDLPATELKIDRAFTIGLTEDARARKMVHSIVELAHAFDLTVVAEGVETEAMREILLELGVDSMQGWLFAPALAPKELEAWVGHFRTPGAIPVPG